MRNCRLARSLLSLVSLLAFAPGCQVLYRYRPLPVLVRDAETKKPIADAEVHLSYPLTRDSLAPFDSSERTGPDGIAHLKAAPYGDFGVRLEATAAGYLFDQQTLSTELIQNIKPAHPFEGAERRPPERVVELYAEPRFTVELIVPPGYRGTIRAKVQLSDDLAPALGQRGFRYAVQDGFVQIHGPGILSHVAPAQYRAVYADGTALTSEMTVLKVGFRWLRREGEEECFVVGTQPEFDMQRRSTADVLKWIRRDDGPSNGGRGRRHRGGD